MADGAVVTAFDIDAFVAELGFVAIAAVGAVPGTHDKSSVHAIFGIVDRKDQVAVLIFVGMRTVVGIFAADVNVVQPGDVVA